MANKKLKRQLLLKKLYNKRRLVILNEDTFEETFSLKLNLMNVFVVGTIGAILIIFVTTYIIAFTPLREYIPGYASSKLKQDALEMAIKSDSLEKSVKINNAYIASIKKVLTGDLEYAKLNKDSIKALDVSEIDVSGLSPTEKEQELRDQVIKEDKYNVFEFQRDFLNAYGVDLTSGPLVGVAARAVVVLDENNQVLHSELVNEIADEPNYEAALVVL